MYVRECIDRTRWKAVRARSCHAAVKNNAYCGYYQPPHDPLSYKTSCFYDLHNCILNY